ncbi:MAG: spore coat protein CotJB [Clostridia bacterium]|nr:spore coat protein CotJB [Clostridia bacterium]
MDEREMLINRIAALDFAIVELNLYMDTHPDDTEVNMKLNDYKEKSMELKNEYQEKFAPLSSKSIEDNRWGWIADPWPWNNDDGGNK